jgi:hypothetical protein
MRLRLLTLITISLLATMASAKEIWLSIGGTTAGGTFRTDARIFNPSTTKDIQIQAWYLPVIEFAGPARHPGDRHRLVSRGHRHVARRNSGLARSDSSPMTSYRRKSRCTSGGTLGQFIAESIRRREE